MLEVFDVWVSKVVDVAFEERIEGIFEDLGIELLEVFDELLQTDGLDVVELREVLTEDGTLATSSSFADFVELVTDVADLD